MNCRFCKHNIEQPFLPLGNFPLSNKFLSSDKLKGEEAYYPLDVFVCPQCFLVQIPAVEEADNIFDENYAYFSSYSDSWLKHAEKYVSQVTDEFNLSTKSQVIEIASNDGYLLQYFIKKNIPALGVEPAKNAAEEAKKKGVPTKIMFFTAESAQELKSEGKSADLIVGNNVFAHVPNLNDFVKGLKILLKEEGVVTLEFPHLLKLLIENQFDTIYHEHYSYFSLYAAKQILEAEDLEIFDVKELPTHGGSLRVFIKHFNDSSKIVNESVQAIIDQENKAGLMKPQTYVEFCKKVETCKNSLINELKDLKRNGARIVGYGAPAKGNTLLNYCNITKDIVEYTVDRSPHKQNKFLPGTHIPIKHPDVIKSDKPDYVFILPWNIKNEIMDLLSYVRDWGGKFIIAIPKFEII